MSEPVHPNPPPVEAQTRQQVPADPLVADRAVLDAFRAGDRGALERVYRAHVDAVFMVVRFGFQLADGRRVAGMPSPDAQRDIVQDVFVRAFAQRARLAYDGLRPYRPWLLRIARNVLADHWRKHGVAVAVFSDADATEVAAPTEDAADGMHWRALRAATQDCVAGLDDEMRTFVRFRYEDGAAQRDVATRMGVTRRRVRTLEEHVLERVRKWLEEKGFC